MAESASSLLAELESLRNLYGGDAALRRVRLLEKLEVRRLNGGENVFRLHELVAFARAYPDNREVLGHAERMLDGFAARSDLRRHRAALADSGIAGTVIHYRFYWNTARWLARRWPDRLSIDWDEFEHRDRLLELLDLLLPYSESPALDLVDLPVREWIHRLKGPAETDAAFLIRRFEELGGDPAVRERLYEQVDVPLELAPGTETPSRTRAYLDGAPVAFQSRPLSRKRPNLRREIDRPPRSVRMLSTARGRRAVDLVREAMVTRSRDLYSFEHADEEDVRIIEFEDGLQFVGFGLKIERRLILESSYGFLTIKNGVPIGYALATSLFRSTEVAYNVFETFRGAEAALVFARLLALVHHLFGSDVFAIDPFQLGYGNDEGLRSGAWWFYYKLGFRPHDPGIRRVLRGELDRLKADPRRRSSLATLQQLAADYLFFYLDRARSDVLGRVSLGNVGLRISDFLSRRFGAERKTAIATCRDEAAELLGVGSRRGFSPGERLAWDRWSPLILILPGIATWSDRDKRSLVEVVQAKGGRRESAFLSAFDRHARLQEAVLRLAK